jgi:hypothetical protein
MGEESVAWVHLVSETTGIPGQDYSLRDVLSNFRIHFKPRSNNLDTNDRDLKLRVYFAKPPYENMVKNRHFPVFFLYYLCEFT